MNKLVDRQIRVLLKQIMDAQRRTSPVTLHRDALAVLLEQFDDPGGRIERLIGGVRDARQEEVEPGFPRAMFAHVLKSGDNSQRDGS